MTVRGEEATLSWGTVHTAPFFLLFRNILGVWGQSPQRIGVSRNTSPKEKGRSEERPCSKFDIRKA